MKSISIQYQELKEGKLSKHQFLYNARTMFPAFVTNQNSLEDSVRILKNRGLLNEGEAVKGTPDKEPVYNYPEEKIDKKYKKVEREPEVQEQDGVYPATTLTDIPKEKTDKKVKSKADGLEVIKDKDTKNEMKKVKVVKESLGGNTLTDRQVMAIAKKAGEIVIDAKEDLIDLVIAHGYDKIPKDKVKKVLAKYDIETSDLKGAAPLDESKKKLN